MSAEQALTPTAYIKHHLSFFAEPVGNGAFWTLHVDSMVTAVLLGVISLGLIWWVVRGATAGVPTKRQAFVEAEVIRGRVLLLRLPGSGEGFEAQRLQFLHSRIGQHTGSLLSGQW